MIFLAGWLIMLAEGVAYHHGVVPATLPYWPSVFIAMAISVATYQWDAKKG